MPWALRVGGQTRYAQYRDAVMNLIVTEPGGDDSGVLAGGG
jgi:hypothetical protein